MTDALFSNNFNGGSEGTGISPANSGGSSGTALDSVQTSTQWTFAAAAARGGAFGALLTLDGSARYLRGDDPAPDGTRSGVRFDLFYPGPPTVSSTICGLRSFESATDAGLLALNFLSTGALRLLRGNGGATVTGSDSAVITPSQWLTIECKHTAGVSSTTAIGEYKVWDQGGSVVANYVSAANLDVGSTFNNRRNRFGMATNTSGWSTLKYDNIRWGRKATGDFGPIPGPPEIVVTIEGVRWTVDVRASTGVGTLTYSIAYSSGLDLSAGITEPVDGFFTIPADADTASSYVITVSNGTDTDTYDVDVPALGSGGAPEIRIRGPLMWNGTELI